MKQLFKFMQVLLLGLLWAGTQSMAVTVTIGTGTITTTIPYYTLYEDSRTQMLYTASEITAGGGMAGNIQSIALNVSSANTLAMNGFNIRMQNTSAISLTGFVTTGWTTVYSGVYSVPGTGWQTIMLQTPFAWDGTSNLLIEICFDNTSWSGNSSVYSTAATNMTWHYHTDGASGCSLTGGSTYSNRPNIQLEITPAITSVTIEIGTGTNTSYRVPWNHFYQYSRTQTIYQQAEINTLGQIQKIYYHVASWPASYTYTQLKIWMGTTTLPSWTATTQWIDNATLTLVYDGPITITSPGWLEIPLQTPFTYNNTENLVISIHEPLNVPSYAGSTYTFYYSTALTNRYLDGYSDSQSWPTSLYMSNYLPNIKIEMLTGPNIPGTLAGVVTNAATGLPVIGAKIQAGDSITYSAVDGSYSMPLPPITIPTVTCSKLGYDVVTINDVEITSCTTTNQNFTLQENTNPPSVVYASLNTAQTAVNITWGLPQGPYEIVYDDGQFENMTAWAVEGNINALKFTPINSYPVQIIGGKVHIGDGSYPSGADLQTFTMAVYDDDGTMGLPNTELATVEVTPTHYGWVEFTFPTPITITSGNFYIGMIQGGNYPNCVPIAIDETNPSMRSYSKFVTGNGPWVPAGYNDFMIRASVIGAGGPLDLATGGNQPAPFIEKHRENTGTYALKIPRLIGGQEGEALYIPIPQNGDNSDVITGYQVWRLKQGEETNPAVWVSIGTPTSTNITDNSWPTLPNGAYRWAVKAKYTGNRWSDASFSNVLGKGWTANVTFNITMCSSTVSPQGATVSLTNTQYPDTAYFAVAPANGIVTFPHVWKGNYDIAVVKFPFNSWTLNDDINGNKTYNVLMKEMTFPPKNMTVDDLSLIATWNAAHINLVCFEEQWNSGSFATQGWTTSGGSNWGISTSTGNPAPSAQFNWSPSVTNYSQTLTSPDITGIGSPGLTLQYDYYLNNFSTATLEELAVEIWNGTTWNQLAHYVNTQGSIPWTHQSININAYTNSTFKIRFRAYGQNCYNINYWNIDNIRVVGSAKAGRDLVGYNVYLNDIQIGFTTDTTYQIPQNLCTYGQTYTACVEAAYECGVSTNSCYTFTAHYLPAPRNLEAIPIQDAAYLTWEPPVIGDKSLQIGIPGMSTESVAEEANDMSTFVAKNINYAPKSTEGILWDNGTIVNSPGTGPGGTDESIIPAGGTSYGWNFNQAVPYSVADDFTVTGNWTITKINFQGYQTGSSTTSTFTGAYFRIYNGNPSAGGTVVWGDLVTNHMTSTEFAGIYRVTAAGGGTDRPVMNIICDGLNINLSAGEYWLEWCTTGTLSSGPWVPNTITPVGNAMQNTGSWVALTNPNPVDLPFVIEGPGGGAAPANLLGYNVYRDGTLAAYVEKSSTEYYDLYLDPGHYCYNITAVYDLEAYGFPAGTTAESLQEGPACVDIDYGYPIPWSEDWISSSFTTNHWTLDPEPNHWTVTSISGNPAPSAEFTWAPPATDYSFALVTPALTSGLFTCADIWLDFEVKLDDRNQTGKESLKVEVLKKGNWTKVAEFINNGSFNWQNQHIDISVIRGKAFKIRFLASGSNSADILDWFVDNINIYPVVYPALNLTAQNNGQNYDVNLQWNSPECPSVATGSEFFEDFEAGVLSPDWEIIQTNTNSTSHPTPAFWSVNNYVGSEFGPFGVYHAGLWWDYSHQDEWLITPEVDIVSDSKLTFESTVWEGSVYGDHYYVKVSTDGGTTWIPVWDASTLTGNGWNYYYYPYSIDLSNFAGKSVKIAFQAIDGDGQGLWYIWFVDNIGLSAGKSTIKFPASSLTYINNGNSSGKMSTQIARDGNTRSVSTEYRAKMRIENESLDMDRGVIGYNIYRDGELITPTSVTDTTYKDVVPSNGTYCYVVKAIHEGYNGATFESAPSNEACKKVNVGIVDNPSANLKVYPNPAKDFVNVETTQDIRSIEMINYLGQSVFKQAVDGKGVYKINTRQLESGIYFVRFTDAKGVVTTERVTITK